MEPQTIVLCIIILLALVVIIRNIRIVQQSKVMIIERQGAVF